MTCEIYWYQCYSEDGAPPSCRRLNRESTEDQLIAAIDLAIAYVTGRAGRRLHHRRISAGGMQIIEEWWYWRPALQFRADRALAVISSGGTWDKAAAAGNYETQTAAKQAVKRLETWTGWWLVPDRIVRRALVMLDAATREATIHSRDGSCQESDVERVLRRWWKRKKHRKFAALYGARRSTDSLRRGYGAWHIKVFSIARSRRKKALTGTL